LNEITNVSNPTVSKICFHTRFLILQEIPNETYQVNEFLAAAKTSTVDPMMKIPVLMLDPKFLTCSATRSDTNVF